MMVDGCAEESDRLGFDLFWRKGDVDLDQTTADVEGLVAASANG